VNAPSISDSLYRQSESRISGLTLLLGVLVAGPVAASHHWQWALGILIGSTLAWLNFRWLKQGLDALDRKSTRLNSSHRL